MKKLLTFVLLLVSLSGAVIRDKATDSLVLSECTEDTALTATAGRWYASAGQPLAYDANGFNGNRGIEVTSINNVTSQARLQFSASRNISTYDLLKVSFKIEDSCRLNAASATYEFRLYLMSDLSNLRQYYFYTRGKIFTRDNWYTITLRLDKPGASTGTLNLANVNYAMVAVQNAVADGALRMTIGKISVCKAVDTTGYFVVSLDGAEKSMLNLALPVFQRYNCKPTMYHIPSRYQSSQYMTWAEVDSVYKLGWEVGHMGYSHANFDTCTAAQIRTEIQRGHDTLAAHGIGTRRLFAFPFGAKSRAYDTIATEYTSVRRGTTGLIDVPGIATDGVYAPMGTGAFITNGGIIQTDTNASGRWATIKIAIDSAVSRKITTGVIIHKFRHHDSTTTGVDMDTATLDTMLHYLDSLKDAGRIDFGGIGKLFTPPPAVITVQPVSDTVVAGQSATFFVTSYSDSVTYQWYRNDSLIAGATNDTFTYTSRLLPAINSKPYRDKIYCLLTTDTTISTNTVYLTGNPPQLSGSKAWQTITINNAGVSETNPHFLYQRKIPRIGAIALNVDSANDVGFTRVNDTIRVPRWVLFTTDTIYLYADIAVNATTDTSYRLHFGKALSEVNASATFSNCGITNFWGFDEASGTTTTDYVGSANGTIVGAATLGNNGLFRNAYSTASGGSINCGQTPIAAGAANLSFTSVVNIVDNTSQMFFERTRDANNVVRFRVNSNLVAEVRNGSTAQYTSTSAFTAVGQFAHIGFSYNAGTMKLYVNGVPFAGSGSGNATLPSLTGFNFNFSGASFPIKGSQDNAALYSITLSDGYYLDRYTMIFTPSTFSTLGAVQVLLKTGSSNNSRNRGFNRDR